MTRQEFARHIEAFLDGVGAAYDWDDLCSARFSDPELEAVRKECCAVDERFPPTRPGEYCNEQGRTFLRSTVQRLRGDAA